MIELFIEFLAATRQFLINQDLEEVGEIESTMECDPSDVLVEEELTPEHEFSEICRLNALSCMVLKLYS